MPHLTSSSLNYVIPHGAFHPVVTVDQWITTRVKGLAFSSRCPQVTSGCITFIIKPDNDDCQSSTRNGSIILQRAMIHRSGLSDMFVCYLPGAPNPVLTLLAYAPPASPPSKNSIITCCDQHEAVLIDIMVATDVRRSFSM